MCGVLNSPLDSMTMSTSAFDQGISADVEQATGKHVFQRFGGMRIARRYSGPSGREQNQILADGPASQHRREVR